MSEKIELYFAVLLSIIAILLLHSAFEKVGDDTSIKISDFRVLKNDEPGNPSTPH